MVSFFFMKRKIQCLTCAEISQEVVPKRIIEMEEAIAKRDFPAFARLACADSNQFHAVCLDTLPPIFYMNDTSHRQAPLFNSSNYFTILYFSLIFILHFEHLFVNDQFESHGVIYISGLSAALRNGIVMKDHLRFISLSLCNFYLTLRFLPPTETSMTRSSIVTLHNQKKIPLN